MTDFEREIEDELHRVLDPTRAGSIPAWRLPSPGSFTKRLVRGAGGALAVKMLTGIAVAGAAATIAGAATETAITGSVSPTVWGQQVKLQVDSCKDRLSAGRHGIGECVSDFTSKHEDTAGETRQTEPPAAAEPKNPGDKKPEGTATPSGRPDVPRHSIPATPPPQGSEHESPGRSGAQSHPIPPRP